MQRIPLSALRIIAIVSWSVAALLLVTIIVFFVGFENDGLSDSEKAGTEWWLLTPALTIEMGMSYSNTLTATAVVSQASQTAVYRKAQTQQADMTQNAAEVAPTPGP